MYTFYLKKYSLIMHRSQERHRIVDIGYIFEQIQKNRHDKLVKNSVMDKSEMHCNAYIFAKILIFCPV